METKKQKALVRTLISYKIHFKTKAVTRNKEGYCIILKGSINGAESPEINPQLYYELLFNKGGKNTKCSKDSL